MPTLVELHAVEDDEAAAVERVAGHERLGEEVEAGAVDDDARPADGVDQRPAGGVAEDVDVAALGAVQERLADVAVDDELAALHDLPELVLPVAVDDDREAVDAGGQVVAGAAVDVDAHVLRFRPQAAAGEALPAIAVADEAAPAQLVGATHQDGVAVVALRREAFGVDDQRLLARLRRREQLARLPVDPCDRQSLFAAPNGGAASNSAVSASSTTRSTELRRLSPVS